MSLFLFHALLSKARSLQGMRRTAVYRGFRRFQYGGNTQGSFAAHHAGNRRRYRDRFRHLSSLWTPARFKRFPHGGLTSRRPPQAEAGTLLWLTLQLHFGGLTLRQFHFFQKTRMFPMRTLLRTLSLAYVILFLAALAAAKWGGITPVADVVHAFERPK